MKPGPPNPHTGSLTAAQLKALFMVASGSDGAAAGPRDHPYADRIEQALADATPVDALTRIKDEAKQLITHAPDARHREAATLLYHVAVAAAFVHHRAEISSRPMRRQLALYERFAVEWAGDPIGVLFREVLSRLAAGPS